MYFSECKCVFLTLGVLIAGVPYSYQISPVLSEELKSDTQDRSYISPDGINCTGCDVGEFVETHCNEPMGRSQCKPCPNGTFSTTPGGDTSCQHCTPCSHGVNETSSCTATSDTVCACPKGTVPNIIDGLILNCKPVETLLPSTKVQETTTKDHVTPSQEYKPTTTTPIPPSNGYETKPTDDNSGETQSLLPSTTEYDTTTTDPVTPSQDYKPRTTHIPPSNGYETKPTDDNSDVTTIILCLYGVLIFCLVGGQVKALFRKWRRRYRKGKFWSCTAGLVYN